MDEELLEVQEGEMSQTTPTDDEFAEIRERFEAGEELSDEQTDQIADAAVAIVQEVLALFGETGSTIDEYEGEEGELILDVNGGDLAVLIGRHGRTLDALQAIVSSLLSCKLHFHFPVVVDIESYKSRRKDKLQGMARSAAERAKRSGGRVALVPMNGYERRLVHLALLDDEEVTTHSEGEDPNRRVIITALKA